jgi:hypothetical protein
METLKGPILPMPPNGNLNGTGPLVPNSAASRTRGKAPKPKVTSIDFANPPPPPIISGPAHIIHINQVNSLIVSLSQLIKLIITFLN